MDGMLACPASWSGLPTFESSDLQRNAVPRVKTLDLSHTRHELVDPFTDQGLGKILHWVATVQILMKPSVLNEKVTMAR